MELLRTFGFFRYKIYKDGDDLVFKDALTNLTSRDSFGALKYNSLEEIAYFQNHFIKLSSLNNSHEISGMPDWQLPCFTEKMAHFFHRLNDFVLYTKTAHLYLGVPWASWIDKINSSLPLHILRVRLSGLVNVLREFGLDIRVHTVCQHIFWDRCIPIWKEIGITDVWLSHMPSYVDPDLPFKIHPWALYAVNVEDPDRKEGIEIGKDPASKTLLASFIGAHSEGYISDVRLELRQFSEEPDFLIRVTDKWHFEDVVYKHQVQGLPLEENYVIDDSVREYNAVLSDSIFALCPSGAGPNSIRLWESLAVGSIPVLLGKFPVLPRGGSLPEIDWDSIVLKISDDQLSQLPQILRSMPMAEIRARQKRGIDAYALVREQRCF